MEHREGFFDIFNNKKGIEESKKEIINECMVEFRKRDLKNNQLFYTVIKKQEDLEGKMDQIIEVLEKENSETEESEDTSNGENRELLSEDVVKRLEEHVHMESVKCFKNVQASVNETLTEKLNQKPNGDAEIHFLKKFSKAMFIFLIIQILLTIAFFLYYIGIIPNF